MRLTLLSKLSLSIIFGLCAGIAANEGYEAYLYQQWVDTLILIEQPERTMVCDTRDHCWAAVILAE